ncbi:MAG: LUD domain-containing protein [Planctomycetota bacterium]|nr:LUD domain-containing protein [Planctomycetota bacterium]MDA1214060.1 LUD domain-containing protein [Planctomycetota bacterium]
MSSREDILEKIRRKKFPDQPLPNLSEFGIVYANRVEQFVAALKSVGGSSLRVNTLAEADQAIRDLDVHRHATKTCSLIPDIGEANVDLDAVDDPHELEDVDVAIFPGEFGVAENGAIWIDAKNVKHRVVYVIAQHIVVVLDRCALVDNMHRAYDRLSFATPGFGMFLSGPSKTADIEQSLVIGAHGPRSLTVVLVENGFSD